jgi:hypothetical protein
MDVRGYTRADVLALLSYLAVLLLILIAFNVVLVRAIRAEKRRDEEERRVKAGRRES